MKQMGSLDTPFELGGGMSVSLPADVYVVANAVEIERLREAASLRRLAEFNCVALEPAEPIPDDVIARAFMLVMEVDPADPAFEDPT